MFWNQKEEDIWSVDINFTQKELRSLKKILILTKTFLFRINRDFKYKYIVDEEHGESLTPEEHKKHLEDYEKLKKDHTEIVIVIDSFMERVLGKSLWSER